MALPHGEESGTVGVSELCPVGEQGPELILFTRYRESPALCPKPVFMIFHIHRSGLTKCSYLSQVAPGVH